MITDEENRLMRTMIDLSVLNLRSLLRLLVVVAMFSSSRLVCATSPLPYINALLITGKNNHNWQFTSRLHKDTLEDTGRFIVDITDDPEKTLADAPALKKYRLFVLDYNDFNEPKRWNETAEKNFIEAVRNGTGVVAIHSANNAFKGWAEYEQMLALMWREGTGHGKFHSFDVTYLNHAHPITAGLGNISRHPDELYHRLVNSQGATFEVLAEAHSSEETGGTGRAEPMAIVLSFGKGRVFATPLGHVWTNQEQTKMSVCDEQFKSLLCRGAEWAATGEVTVPEKYADPKNHNLLSAQEQAAGWVSLFDGASTALWRGYKKDAFPGKGWTVREGMLIVQANGGGGDIITVNEYGDFEFECDWRVGTGGNSGIMYRCDEDHEYPWQSGIEMQILDNTSHADGKEPKTSAGSLYAIVAPSLDVVRPAGQWNHARIVARGSTIQHFLNGFMVLEVDLNSDEYKSLRAQSKWARHSDMGTLPRGRIALQDHGDEVAFRAIRIRPLN